jgi:hypothetical protein
VLLALSVPAAAQAAPHWSSPKQVIAAPPSGTVSSLGTPEALVTPTGGLLAFGGDTIHPVVLLGTIAGGFGAPIPLDSGTAPTARGAVGADGTSAAAWEVGGQARVAVAAPGARFGSATALPGAGVNAIDVAVAADGTTTVAYRTHAASGYQLLAATAPKGQPFGVPQVLDSGTSAIGSVRIAAGPGGAVAIVYTHIAGTYRTRATVRAAGAASFDAPQTLSSGTQSDIDPQVAFDADGTIVAAWANPGGAQYALRGPGQAGFTAPVALGVGSVDLDLTATPQGLTALAVASSDHVLVAVQSPGAGFALTPIASFTGEFAPTPSIAVDAAGTAYVVFANPQSGAVSAAILGGASTVIGYGTPNSQIPTADAAGAAGQAVALWANDQGGLSAATFGDTAAPNTGIGSPPSTTAPGHPSTSPHASGPKVRLRSSRTVTVSARTTSVRLVASCNRACAIGYRASLSTTVHGHRRTATLPSRNVGRASLRSGRQTLTLKLGARALTDLRRALKARRGAQVLITLQARDAAHHVTTVRIVLALHPAHHA